MCVLLPTLVLVVLLIEYSMLSGTHALASSQSITGLVDFLYSKALTLSLAHPSHHSTADCLHTIYPSTIGFTKISKHNWKIKEQDQDTNFQQGLETDFPNGCWQSVADTCMY